MINSRQKGAQAERDVLKMFRDFFGGEPWKRRGLGQSGADITTPVWFPWTMEVKNTKKVEQKHLVKPNQFLHNFWDQACQQVEGDKAPLLVLKADGDWFVVEAEQQTTLWSLGAYRPVIYNTITERVRILTIRAFFEAYEHLSRRTINDD